MEVLQRGFVTCEGRGRGWKVLRWAGPGVLPELHQCWLPELDAPVCTADDRRGKIRW
jgi:hypothetical protein